MRRGDQVQRNGAGLRQVRSGVLFVVGLVGIGYETIVEHTERPTLLLLFAAMIGLPAFLRLDERRNNNHKDPG